jgi:hypothetical protein
MRKHLKAKDLGLVRVTRDRSEQTPRKTCNICGRAFRAQFSRELYCRQCRHASELFRYHDWLPGTA